MNLVLGVGLAEGGKILAGVSVQHQLVLDEAVHCVGICLVLGNLELAEGGSCSSFVEQVIIYGLVL